jgi:hypothetical protein
MEAARLTSPSDTSAAGSLRTEYITSVDSARVPEMTEMVKRRCGAVTRSSVVALFRIPHSLRVAVVSGARPLMVVKPLISGFTSSSWALPGVVVVPARSQSASPAHQRHRSRCRRLSSPEAKGSPDATVRRSTA